MADENTPAFYPRVGKTIAKNFRSAQPAPFIEDPRAMDLPQFGEMDLSKPTKENLEMGKRIAQRDAELKRQSDADMSPLEKIAGGLQAGRLIGSGLVQSVASIPTAITKGSKAAEDYIAENMYKPTQPLAYEYAGDVGDFLEKLETQYKIPPILPEAVALQYLTGPATSQAMRTAGRGAEQAGRAIERRMEPVVKGALERGGLPREMVMAMGANTQSNVIKPKGGNWLNDSVEQDIAGLKRDTMMGAPNDTVEDVLKKKEALNNWVDRNLTNYIKKEMATPEDPVRKLAEEGIVHFPVAEDPRYWARHGESAREQYGGTQMAQSDLAKQWENRTDPTIRIDSAKDYQDFGDLYPEWMKKLDPEANIYQAQGAGGRMSPEDLGFDHILDVLREDLTAGRIRPEQLNKVSMEQAVRRTFEYDQEMARKMAQAQAKVTEGMPVYKEYPEGYKWIELAPSKEKKVYTADNLPEGYELFKDRTGFYQVVNKNVGEVPTTDSFAKTPEQSLSMFNKWAKQKNQDYDLQNALKYEGNTMGHCVGGYCPDVVAGRTRIYSLRDAKGEPHVTIEVEPQNEKGYYNSLDPDARIDLMNKAIEYRRQKNPNFNEAQDSTERALLLKDYLEAQNIEIPSRIKQIKGKQNAKPIQDYIPFVQDFVRSGNWSDVGDFKNTDLISADQIRKAGWDMTGVDKKYFTKQEYEDLLRAEQNRVEGKGMKRGGKVSISNNPDTMMLELGNQKMKNGVPAYAGGKLIVGKGLKAAKPPKVEVPRIAMQFGNDLPLNMADDLIKRSPSVDRINMNYKDVTKRVPELTEAAQRLQAGELDRETYAKLVQALKPVKPYDFVPKPATADEARGALKEDARDTYGVPSQTLEAGHPVGLRLDIPAYTNKGVWVPTVHEQDSGFGAGKKIGHESVASVLNPEFGMSEKAALSIASGKPKGTIATIKGDWNPTSEADIIAKAKEYLKHPEWRQVGMDPERHSYFYDRETMAPVVNAEEVIQIGPLVLAKNPKFGKVEDFKYSGGGLTGAINLGLKAAKPAKIDVPIRFPVSRGPSVPEIRAMAERMAPQVMGEFVRAAPTPSNPKPSTSVTGKTQKQFEREKTLPIEYQNIKEPVTPEEFDYAQKKGALLIGAQGDVTPGNRMLMSIDEQPLSVPVHLQAGPEWELYNPSAWAASDQMAKTYMNRADKAAEAYNADPYLHYHKMTPDANFYAMHHLNSVLGHLRPEELMLRNPKLYQQMVEEIRTRDVGFGKHPEFEGFEDPLNLQIHAQMDPNFRRHLSAIFNGPKFTERYGLNSGQDVMAATSLPELRDLEAGASGYAIVPLDVKAPLKHFEAESQTYDTGFPKAGASGRSKYPSPYQLIYRDTLNWMKDNPSEKKSSEFGRMNMIVPKQQIDNELIEAIGEYQRRMKELTGKKKGGAVKKAAGGAITGDDLIVEERPL
jgi:hypothetical protein